MCDRQPDVFIQMKKFDAAPVNLWHPDQRIQELELRRASGRDDACRALLLDG